MTTYSALKKLGPLIREELVLVIGAGGLGLMCVSILKAMGGKGAVVVDIDEKRRDAATTAGAIAAIDGAAPDALKRITAALGGLCRAAIEANETTMAGASRAAENAARSGECVFVMMRLVFSRLRREIERGGGRESVAGHVGKL